MLSSSTFHFLSSPNDATDQFQELLKLRQASGIEVLPTIIWEPAPLACLPSNLKACLDALEYVDVFSPNHRELAALFNIDFHSSERFDRAIIEGLANKCLARGIGSLCKGTIVIRAGREGCCVYSRKRKALFWLPSFYADSTKVTDPTGAGNAFLGGFAVGLVETGDDVVAACYGTVASTFALEQVGLPDLEPSAGPSGDGSRDDSELWNQASVRARLQEYISRIDNVLVDYPLGIPKSPTLLLGDETKRSAFVCL